MSSAQPHSALRIDPSWFTDPAPPFWRLLEGLDRRVQLEAVNVLLDTQIAVAKAQLDGFQKFKKVIAGAKAPAARSR